MPFGMNRRNSLRRSSLYGNRLEAFELRRIVASRCHDRMVRNAKTSSEGAGPPPQESDLITWFFRPPMLFRMALVAGVCALWPYAAQRLPSLGKRSEYHVSFGQIQIHPRPESPVPGDLLEQVERLADFHRELSILDERLTADVAAAFGKHPWVSKVVRVQKAFPASISVELEYRRPVATVQVSGLRIPVDGHAVILPMQDLSKADVDRYPLITNIYLKPTVKPGTVSTDPALIAATKLADLLREKWSPLKLEAISATKLASGSTAADSIMLELRTKGGSKILWGRVPGSDHPGELEPTQKIRRLENYLTEFGDYLQPHGPYEIDIRHWRENSRRPLPSEAAQSKPTKHQKEESRTQHAEGKRKSRG